MTESQISDARFWKDAATVLQETLHFGYHDKNVKMDDCSEPPCEFWRKEFKNRPPNESDDIPKINRVEVINHAHLGKGREYVFWQERVNVKIDIQDDGKTLKVFITD